jgi:WD40 repeat protein
MADDSRVRQLLEEALDSGLGPEEVCRAAGAAELLPQVRRRWQRLRLLQTQLGTIFPLPGPLPPAGRPPGELPLLPGYEVQSVLGRGGMGVVYRARHLRLERAVALKMLLAGASATVEERERFLREARAVAGLRHPNIIAVHDVSEAGGQLYLTMEYVEGGSLAQKLAGTPQPARQAAALVATLAEAVQVAHRGGIIHRDLKPANILLTADGTPKVADFGLARRLEGGAGLTLTGVPVGTPSYMAPEQARGETRAVGPAVDVYALGAILYELLTGRPPFRAETPVETVLQVIHQEPVPPARLNARVPRDLDQICLKCLQKDPKRRYANAGELADDLGRYLKHQPIRARPAGPGQSALRWMRRHVGLTAGLAGMGFLLVLLLAGALWSAAHFRDMEREQRGLAQAKGRLADENEKERKKAVEAEKREAALRLQAEKQARELRQNLYFAGMSLAGQAATSPSGIGQVSRWLAPWENDAPDLRDWEWYYLKGLCHRDLLTLRGHVGDVLALAWGKDGRLASAGSDEIIRLWDAVGGREVHRLDDRLGAVVSLAWSPDGTRLASAGWDGTVEVVDVVSGRKLLAFRGHARQAHSVTWSPDGKRLASAGGDHTVGVWDAARGVGIHVLRGHTDGVRGVAWSPDGKRLASAGQDRSVRLWDAQTGKAGPVLTGHINWVNCVAWGPDGSRLASASNDQTIKVWDPNNARAIRTLQGHAQGVSSVAWSPDGLRLASSSEDQTVKVWPLSGGAEACTLRGHTGALTSVAWSPDGRRLASAGFEATIKVWDASAGPETPVLRGHGGAVSALAWHPDGQRLASAGADGTVRIWELARSREQTTLPGQQGWVRSAAWSPGGTRLAYAGTGRVIHLWDTVHGRQLEPLTGHTGDVSSVTWSPDGMRLASGGSDRSVRIWDVKTGKQQHLCRGHEARVHSVAWSPDGRRLASASADRTVRVWGATTGRESKVLRVHSGQINSVAWSPDGKWLASAGDDATIQVSNVATGAAAFALSGHTARVNTVAWSPDGARLASGGDDRTVKTWDAATGKETLTIRGGANAVKVVTWGPHGNVLLSAETDGTILVHDATAGYRAVRSPRHLPALDRRLAADPTSGADWRLRAEIHARRRNWEEAAADVRRWLALNPDARWCVLGC